MIKHATTEDLPIIMHLIEEGRKKMIAQGNTRQWTKGHPTQEQVLEDISRGYSYLIMENYEAVCTFALVAGPDETYAKIYDGSWPNDDPYYVIHRVASSPSARGMMRQILDYAFTKASTIRIDTHEDNHTMRCLLEKNGFTYCGIIHLANGDPRLAFAKTIT